MTVTATTVLAERTELGSGLLLRVQGPRELLACRPGQFLMLRCGPAWTPYLRRALFPADVREDSMALWIDSLAVSDDIDAPGGRARRIGAAPPGWRGHSRAALTVMMPSAGRSTA